MYPIKVEFNEENIKKLLSLFSFVTKTIQKEILIATDFGVARRREVLGKIQTIAATYGDEAIALVQKDLPEYYMNGVKNADSQFKNIGISPLSGSFTVIHQEAILALVDDTSRAIAEAMTGVTRNAETLLNKALREEITLRIAKGQVAGDALRDTTRSIKDIVRQTGIVSLKDRAGRSWELDRYAEMLIRTKSVESRNRGLANRVAETGFDLVQVSDHVGECDLCAPWEGRILSLTGETKGYPTVAQAESDGLFHPNCKHAINVIIPSLAKKTKAYYPEEKTRVISTEEIRKATRPT